MSLRGPLALALALVASTLIAGAATARAGSSPRIDLAGCDVFDVDDTLRAIAAELTSVSAERAGDLPKLVVTLTCPDTLTAIVTVTPAPPDGPLIKRLDLGDLPADFRLRAVALAAAELVDVALEVAATMTDPPPPDPRDPVPAPAPTRAPTGAPTSPDPTPAPPSATRDVAPLLTAPGEIHRAADPPPDRAGIVATVRGGVLAFLDPATTPLVALAVEATRGRLAVDLFFATGTVDDPLGDLRAYAAGLGVAATFACHGRPHLRVCASARVAAGVAAADATAHHDAIVDHDAASAYLEAGPRLELRLDRRPWSTSLVLGVAWSSGLTARADDREVLHLGGAILSASLGIGWGR